MNVFIKEFSISKFYDLSACWIVWIIYILTHFMLKLAITIRRISNGKNKLVLDYLRFKYTYNIFLLLKAKTTELILEVGFIFFTD